MGYFKVKNDSFPSIIFSTPGFIEILFYQIVSVNLFTWFCLTFERPPSPTPSPEASGEGVGELTWRFAGSPLPQLFVIFFVIL
jgi:hypothetical protein